MNPSKLTQAWFHLQAGHTCREKGQREQAATHYQTARQLFRAQGCPKGLLAACTQLGLAGDLDESLRYFQVARAACSPSRSLRDIAEAEGYVGFIQQSQSRFAEAAAHCHQALQYAQRDGDKRREQNEWVAALRLFKQLGMERHSQAVIRAMAA